MKDIPSEIGAPCIAVFWFENGIVVSVYCYYYCYM